jgi:hypothetical protein
MEITLDLNRRTAIRWALTAGISFSVGFVLALWVTRLDPDGNGGSVLAMPAIMAAAGISFIAFCFGVFTFYVPVGRSLLASSFLIPAAFLLSTALVR